MWENLQANPMQENSWANLAPQTEEERIGLSQEVNVEDYTPTDNSDVITELHQPIFSKY